MDSVLEQYAKMIRKLSTHAGRLSIKGKLKLLQEMKVYATENNITFSNRHESLLEKLKLELNQIKHSSFNDKSRANSSNRISIVDRNNRGIEDKIHSFSSMDKEQLKHFLSYQLHSDLIAICHKLGAAAYCHSIKGAMINTIIRIVFKEPFIFVEPKNLIGLAEIKVTEQRTQLNGQLKFTI